MKFTKVTTRSLAAHKANWTRKAAKLERELREGRLVHVPLDTPTTLYSELGVYVRAGRTLPSALDAFNRIVADAIESREDEESVALREWVARTQTTAVAASARS